MGISSMKIDLKEIILDALSQQRLKLIMSVIKSDSLSNFETTEEASSWLQDMVFQEDDILERALKSLELTIDNINANEFRDYQHETISLCIKLRNKSHETSADK